MSEIVDRGVPTDASETMFRHEDCEPYLPSCGAEGDIFLSHWCEKCSVDRFHEGGGSCQILMRSLIREQPEEWQYRNGLPVCTAFQSKRDDSCSAPCEAPGQMSIFATTPTTSQGATNMQIKEKPILFNGSMVRAIFEGRKTKTRRVVKLPKWSTQSWDDFEIDLGGNPTIICADTGCSSVIQCPYGQTGDRLWGRETFATDIPGCPKGISYKADHLTGNDGPTDIKWRPSIFMPRDASRISLEIKAIRVERLQKITTQDAIAEGIPPFDWDDGESLRPISAFRALWDSINESRGYGWESNPWVWVIEFEVAEYAESGTKLCSKRLEVTL